MEKKEAENFTSSAAEADVPVDQDEKPEKLESSSAADKFTPQDHDVPVAEAVKPERSSVTNFGALESNADISDQGTGEADPQLSENMDIKLPEQHEKPEEQNFVAEKRTPLSDEPLSVQLTPELAQQVSDPMETSETEKNLDIKSGTPEAGLQSEPMDMSLSDQVGLKSRSERHDLVDDELPHQQEKPDGPEMNRTAEKSASRALVPDQNTAEPTNRSLIDEREKPEMPGSNSASENCAPQNHDAVPDTAAAKGNPQLNEAMDTRISDEEELCSNSQNKAVGEEVSPMCGGGSLALLSRQYRDDGSEDVSDSDSDSSSSTSSSSSSSSSGVISSVMNELDQEEDQEEALYLGKRPRPVKTQDELLIEDLPSVENLKISLPEDTVIEPVGVISSIIDQLVIVESKKDLQPLNDDSVLFNKDRTAIGKVFEVFGPVCQPYYVLRFNSKEDIEEKNLKTGESVFFAPKIRDFTDYIFTEELNKMKGSDASWKNDQEPPPEALDFSDDEEERLAKQKLKEQKRQQKQQQKREESESEDEKPSCRPRKPPRRKPQNQNWHPHHNHPTYNNPHGGFHSNYHANPHFQAQDNPRFPSQGSPRFQPQGSPQFQPQGNHFRPDHVFPPPNPFHPPFQGPNFAPYPGLPPPRMGMGPWGPGPYPGMMFHLPPPPPPPPPPSN